MTLITRLTIVVLIAIFAVMAFQAWLRLRSQEAFFAADSARDLADVVRSAMKAEGLSISHEAVEDAVSRLGSDRVRYFLADFTLIIQIILL